MEQGVPILKTENISKNFGGVKALNNVSFELERGRILGLVGDNGAGKSTFLRILVGDLQPSSGKIYLDGEEVHFRSPADAMEKGIAIAYQFLELVDSAKVWENFFMGRELTKKVGVLNILDIKNMKNSTAEAIGKYGYTFDIEQEAGKLSGDERQITVVTRAIESDPKVLLLDESFTMLSMEGRERVIKFLREVNEKSGVSMIVVSHDLDLIKQLSHYIMILKAGEKVFFGRNDEISIDGIIEYMLP